MTQWPQARVGDVLKKSMHWTALDDGAVYTEPTVRLWGRGVVARGQAAGSELAASRRHVIRTGQLLVSRIDARHGAAGVVPPTLDGAVATNDFIAFSAVPGVLLPEFLGVVARTEWFVDMCARSSKGTTNRVRLKEQLFLDSAFPLPPLQEQQRIVDAVSRADAIVAEHEAIARGRSRQLDDVLFSAYCRLTSTAPRARMGDVAPLVRRPVIVDTEAFYPELGVRSFGKGTFHKAPLAGFDVGSKKLFYIHPGDLVLSNVFAWEGAIAVAREEDKGRVGSHRFITCVPDPTRATASYLRYHFLTEQGLRDIGQASPGGAGRNRTLGLVALARIEVPLPSLDDQRWFERLQTTVAALLAEQGSTVTLRSRLVDSLIRESAGV